MGPCQTRPWLKTDIQIPTIGRMNGQLTSAFLLWYVSAISLFFIGAPIISDHACKIGYQEILFQLSLHENLWKV